MKKDKRPTTRANREKILHTAARLIIEQGIDSTSLADIAVAAGISKGTLFYYYPSKADLIFDITERHMDHVSNKIFNWVQRSAEDIPPDRVIRLVFETLVGSPRRGEIHLYLIQEALTHNPSLRSRFIEEYGRWRELIEEGLRRLFPERSEYELRAQMILAAIDGLLLQKLLGVETLSLQSAAAYFARD